MKRKTCLLLALVLMFSSVATAESMISIQVLFPEEICSDPVEFEFIDAPDKIRMTSSLLDQKIIADLTEDELARNFISNLSSIITLLSPDTFSKIREILRDLTAFYREQQNSGKPGSYTGDLFESASIEYSADFTSTDFESVLQHVIGIDNPDDESNQHQILQKLFQIVKQIFLNRSLSFTFKCYDNGEYATLLVYRSETLIYTISFDFSEQEKDFILFRHNEKGKNIYYLLSCMSEKDHFNCETDYYIGTVSSFKGIDREDTLFTESFSISRTEHGQSAFQYAVSSETAEETLHIDGTILKQSEQLSIIDVRLFFPDSEGKDIHILVSYNRDSHPDDLPSEYQILRINEENANDVLILPMLAAASNLYSKMLPYIPSQYRILLDDIILLR